MGGGGVAEAKPMHFRDVEPDQAGKFVIYFNNPPLVSTSKLRDFEIY